MTVEEIILTKMADCLDEKQMEKLKNVLILALYKDEHENKQELMCVDENTRILNTYFASLKIGGRSEKTIKKYALDIRMMLDFFNNLDLTKINTNEIRYYLAWYKENRQVTNTTLENMRLSLNAFFKWMENEDYIAKNPMRKIPPIKKDTQPEQAFTSSEIESLKIHTDSPRDKAMITFLSSTCCRISEMCLANISDVDFDKHEVTVHGKGNKDRIVYLDDIAVYYLKEYLNQRTDDNEALFVTERGEARRIKKNSAERMFARLGEKVEIDGVHPHRFRSSQITNLLKKGMSIQHVQNLAGHENITTTEKYNKLDKTLVKNEFMRLT